MAESKIVKWDREDGAGAIFKVLRDKARPVFDFLPGEYVIAGGFCRYPFSGETERKDIDLWFRTVKERNESVEFLRGRDFVPQGSKDRKPDVLARAWVSSKGGVYDLIARKGWKMPRALLDGFDLTCCACAIERDGTVWAHEDFVQDASRRLLVAYHPDTVANCLTRVVRLGARGFVIPSYKEAERMIRVWHEKLEEDARKSPDGSSSRRQPTEE